jgi:hypothetical protein
MMMCGVKLIKNQTMSLSLNIVIDNPESVVEVVSSIIVDDLILLLNSLTFT